MAQPLSEITATNQLREKTAHFSRRAMIGLGVGAATGVGAAGLTLGNIGAQDATPAAATPDAGSPGISLAAGGLTNPRGMTWSSDGTMYVALAGSGGTTMSETDSPHDQQYGPFFGGDTASVVKIERAADGMAAGCPVTVAGGLPSTSGMGGHTQGPAAVAFLEDQLYILQDSGTAAATAFPDLPNGVYVVNPDGSVALVADIKKWHDENPVAHVPYDLTEESETFAMLPGDGFLWVLESNSGQVLQVIPEVQIVRVADLSEGHPVPTGFALADDGGVYVGFLTPAPYTDGSSKIVKVTPDGKVSDIWTGLTMVTGIAVGADGTLYALEMATNNLDKAPFTLPGTGRIVRQTGPDALAEVVVGLDFPIAMAMGPDDALYVSFPAFAAEQELGGVLRIDPGAAQPMRVPPDILALNQCAVATPVPATPGAVHAMATSVASPATTPEASPDAAARANDDGKSATGAQAVQIHDFAFTPATLDVPVGTIVTWTNLDNVAHTVTSDDGTFDSGNLNQHEQFSFRFKAPGSFAYKCSYHPSMLGTIIAK